MRMTTAMTKTMMMTVGTLVMISETTVTTTVRTKEDDDIARATRMATTTAVKVIMYDFLVYGSQLKMMTIQ